MQDFKKYILEDLGENANTTQTIEYCLKNQLFCGNYITIYEMKKAYKRLEEKDPEKSRYQIATELAPKFNISVAYVYKYVD